MPIFICWQHIKKWDLFIWLIVCGFCLLLMCSSTTIIIRQSMYSLTVQRSRILLLICLILASIKAQDISPDSCLQYSGGICIRCDRQTHLDRGICYTNILGCLQYVGGTTCIRCETANFVLAGSTCKPLNVLTPDILNRLHLYGGVNSTNPGDQYGQSGFQPASFEEVQNLSSFRALNTFIRVGQYSHFISRSGNPIYSVHYYIRDNVYSYKILYYGSGGGLFLCIADVPQNLNVRLRSLTPISASNVIDFCIDYDTGGKCLRCAPNYHLEVGRCYINFGGCVRYRENICLQCMDYYFLIENRCISDCYSVSDARSILYYGQNRGVSSLQATYGININQFYSLSIRNTTNTIITTFTTASRPRNPFGSITSGNSINLNQITPGNLSLNLANLTNTSVSTSSNGGSSQNIVRTTTTTTVTTTTFNSSSGSGMGMGNISGFARDPNCALFDPSGNGKCSKCANFYFKNNVEVCQQVSPFCGTYDENNGQCLSCYPGYYLQAGECKVSS